MKRVYLRCYSRMNLISLDMSCLTNAFVKDQTQDKGPAVKRPVRFPENYGSFLKDELMLEKFRQFCEFDVL